ncbi:16S rRNA (guanine(966)-N(2))-methyltransferase RsmD [Halothiobacillus sp. DCM-1]|uniref:16S rRNA (guanine(966)-N(2))-methyltransferase RsmD n=1 Tax=Halothiobacillus sp. DCM-1 TaxID=3112558 RepID=UPI00324CB06E
MGRRAGENKPASESGDRHKPRVSGREPGIVSGVVSGRQQVRITGGIWRSRRLSFPAMPGLRPTPDRVRETLFNWLGQDLSGWRVLDLFAGSGVLGFEALSRGAAWLGSVEQASRTASQLRQSAQSLGVSASTWQLWQMDALAWLDQAPRLLAAQRLNLVLLDPPFASPALLSDALARLSGADWLAPDAWLYLECSAQIEVPAIPGWSVHRTNRAGESQFALWRRQAMPSSSIPE